MTMQVWSQWIEGRCSEVRGDAPSFAVSRQIFSKSSSDSTAPRRVRPATWSATWPTTWPSLAKNLARCAQRARVASSSGPPSASRSINSRPPRDNSSYDRDCCFLLIFDAFSDPQCPARSMMILTTVGCPEISVALYKCGNRGRTSLPTSHYLKSWSELLFVSNVAGIRIEIRRFGPWANYRAATKSRSQIEGYSGRGLAAGLHREWVDQRANAVPGLGEARQSFRACPWPPRQAHTLRKMVTFRGVSSSSRAHRRKSPVLRLTSEGWNWRMKHAA